jgi:diguanylate cyclase (GGDEF)-like protein
LILPHADSAAAGVVRNRIQQQMAATRVPAEDCELEISLSVGIASMPDDADASAALIAAADAAMYSVKQSSRSARPQPERSGVLPRV